MIVIFQWANEIVYRFFEGIVNLVLEKDFVKARYRCFTGVLRSRFRAVNDNRLY